MRFIYTLFTLTLNLQLCLAQTGSDGTAQTRNSFDISKNLFTTPDVTQFHISTFFDSKLYTGKLDLKIPIYDIKYGDINIPIYLSYNSGGIKIDEISTNVGTGWNLIAGGSIIKSVKDIDDFEWQASSWWEYDWDYNPGTTHIYVSTLGFNRKREEINKIGQSYNSNNWMKDDDPLFGNTDAYPDTFIVSAPNLQTSFFVKTEDLENNIHNIIQLSGKELKFKNPLWNPLLVNDLKGFNSTDIKGLERRSPFIVGKPGRFGDIPHISPKVSNNDFQQFEISDMNGIQYVFSDLDITESVPSVVPTKGADVSSYNYHYKRNVTTWHLSKMEDVKNNKVEFFYDTYQNDLLKTSYERSNDVFRSSFNPFNNAGCVFGLYPRFGKLLTNGHIEGPGEVDEKSYKSNRSYSFDGRKNRIKQIKFGNNYIDFVYNNNRLDYPNEKSLDEVIIREGNNIIKKLKFVYSYFISKENCNEWQCYRLKLDEIKIVDKRNIEDSNYSFSYYYDNNNRLPKFKSSQQDYLGYYNANGVEQVNDDDNKIPTLYYHKNQGRYSILPFKRADGTFTKNISGNYSLEPNSHSLIGLLKSVKLPTGGSTEFEYENHDFQINNFKYLAGGARLKRQILKDNNGNIRKLEYDYSENGKTSGFINNLPSFGQIWGFNKQNTDLISFISYEKPRNEIELTEGAFVGYSKVTVSEEDNGFTEYFFTSSKDFPNEDVQLYENAYPSSCIDFLLMNSSYPNVAFIDNDIQRGKLISKKVFNNYGKLINEEKKIFEKTIFSNQDILFRRYIDDYSDIQGYTMPIGHSLTFQNKLKIQRVQEKQSTNINYFDNNQTLTTTNYSWYDANYPLIKRQTTTNSKGETLTTEYQYPADLATRQNTIWDKMVDRNMIGTAVRTKVSNTDATNNTVVLSEERTTFNTFLGSNGSQLILPQYVYAKKGAMSATESVGDRKITYNSYDLQGNLTQYTLDNGIPVAIIWGYNGQYPIAKVEGQTYASLGSRATALITASNSSTGLKAYSFDALRTAFPNALVTGYVYQPLVGVTTIVQPNGQAEYYNYDAAGRLEEIRNHRGEILKTFEYNYAQP